MRDEDWTSLARGAMPDPADRAVSMPMNRSSEWGRAPALDVTLLAAVNSGATSPDLLREYVLHRRRFARWALDAELMQALAGLGTDPREVLARELTARVADLNLCELLQTIAMGRKDATIDLFQGSSASRIWCVAGDIVDAASGRREGEPAVYRILAADDGEIVADYRPVHRGRVIERSTLTLMLEASRRKDECALLAKHLGGPRRAYRAVAGARALAETASADASLLAAFEAGASVEEVLANGERDELSMLQAMAKLVEHGALVPVDAPQPVTLLEPPDEARPETPAAPRAAEGCPARPRRAVSGWSCAIVGALGLLMTLGLLRWNGPRVAVDALEARGEHELAPALAPQTAATPAPHPAPRAEPDSSPAAAAGHYAVRVSVQPDRAELWLDDEWMGTGELSIVLERSGQTHELRIAAPDYQPLTLLFRDTPPPPNVRLVPAQVLPATGD